MRPAQPSTVGILVMGDPVPEAAQIGGRFDRHPREDIRAPWVVPEAAQIGGRFDAMVRKSAGSAWAGAYETTEAVQGDLPAVKRYQALVVTGSPASGDRRAPMDGRGGGLASLCGH